MILEWDEEVLEEEFCEEPESEKAENGRSDTLFEEMEEDADADDEEPQTEISGEGHCLAFASDLHGKADVLENAMKLFPQTTEYVSIIGDLVGEGSDKSPTYRSSTIFERIASVFEEIIPARTSIIWADHDGAVNDNLGIVKCSGGDTSGLIYTGYSSDGSVAYYIYGVGYYHMIKGGSMSREAAQEFKEWVKAQDLNIPVIVLCHVPLQAKRGDNLGASYWNEALNYAATGVEGITVEDPDTDYDIIRNVIYLYGHNHTVDKTEYVFRAGTTMNVQIDTSTPQLQSAGEVVMGQPVYDEELGDKAGGKGIISDIYYTACIPGYLKTSGNATLLRITDNQICLGKYNGGNQTALGQDGATGEPIPGELVIRRVRYGAAQYQWSDDLSMVTAKRVNARTGGVITETVHTTSVVTKAASCEQDGEKTYAAAFTLPVFETQTAAARVPAAGHSFTDWEITKGTTALSEGMQSRHCIVCGKVETKTILRLAAWVKLGRKKLTIKKGKKAFLTIRSMTTGDEVLKWKSSNKKIATVTKKGVVKAKKKGKCTITLYMKSGATARCKVTVKK